MKKKWKKKTIKNALKKVQFNKRGKISFLCEYLCISIGELDAGVEVDELVPHEVHHLI